jgi:prepilin-type N-terminal cleavage/methylation domain-containing protein
MKRKAFTLIELMVVMAIIAVLSTLIIGAISVARKTSKETTNRGNARSLETALEAFYAKNKSYCKSDSTDPAIPKCNNSTGCGVGNTGVCVTDMNTVAAKLVNAGLLNSTFTNSCKAGNKAAGGGAVYLNTNTFQIFVAKSDCADIVSNDANTFIDNYSH